MPSGGGRRRKTNQAAGRWPVAVPPGDASLGSRLPARAPDAPGQPRLQLPSHKRPVHALHEQVVGQPWPRLASVAVAIAAGLPAQGGDVEGLRAPEGGKGAPGSRSRSHVCASA